MREIDVAVHRNSRVHPVAGRAGKMPHTHRRVNHVTLVGDEGGLRFKSITDLALHDEPELGRGHVEMAVGGRSRIRAPLPRMIFTTARSSVTKLLERLFPEMMSLKSK